MEPRRVCQAGGTIKFANARERTSQFVRRCDLLLPITETSKEVAPMEIGPIGEGAHARAGVKEGARAKAARPAIVKTLGGGSCMSRWAPKVFKRGRPDACSVFVWLGCEFRWSRQTDQVTLPTNRHITTRTQGVLRASSAVFPKNELPQKSKTKIVYRGPRSSVVNPYTRCTFRSERSAPRDMRT